MDLNQLSKVILDCAFEVRKNIGPGLANIPLYGAQCLTYLKATGLTLGLVINFGCPLLKEGIERVINGRLDP